MNRITVSAFALVATAAIISSPSCAAPHASLTISYHDLNLATPDGARRLLARIERAAEKVCGGDPWKRQYKYDETIPESREFNKCMAAAVSQAVASLNAPLVRQAYEGYARDGHLLAAR